MIFGGKGGGNTKTGLTFEGNTDLSEFLNAQKDYYVSEGNVFYKNDLVGRIFKKHGFYKFLDELKIEWKNIVSKRLLPDDSIFVIIANTLFIIECKFLDVQCKLLKKLHLILIKHINLVVNNII